MTGQTRKGVGEGRIAKKLADLVMDLLERERPKYSFSKLRIFGTQGANRHVTYDGDRWEALVDGAFKGQKEHSTMTFCVRSMDTMTRCVRHGLVMGGGPGGDSYVSFWVSADD